MMSAALNTTERGPKTTKARAAKKREPDRETLAEVKARYAAEVAERHAEAMAAAGGYPTLVGHISDWLPLAQVEFDLSAVHTDLQNRHAPAAVQAHAEDIWHDAMEVTRAARLRLLNSPTTDPQEVLAKVAAFVSVSGRPVPELLDGEACENALVASLLKDLAALPPQPPQTDRADHDNALATYLAIKAERGQISSKSDAARAAFLDALPPELTTYQLHSPHKVLRWTELEDLLNDPLVSEADREGLAAKLVAALEAYKFVETDDEALALDVALDEHARRQDTAEMIWLSHPSPDLAASVYRARHEFREGDVMKLGVDEPSYAAFLRATGKAGVVDILRDQMRFIGLDHPLRDERNYFQPSWWLDVFESEGGIATVYNGELLLCHPPFASADSASDIAECFNDLREAPWRAHAVYLIVEKRQRNGGDQFFTADRRRRTTGWDHKMRPLAPPLTGSCGHRIATATRVSFSQGERFFSGSIAEHGVSATFEDVILGPSHPLPSDLVRVESADRLREVAATTEEGRAALAEVEAFDAKAVLSQIEAVPGLYVDERHGLLYFEPGHPLTRGPVRPADPPAWKALTPWQKTLVRRASAEGIRRLKVDEALEWLAAARRSMTTPHDRFDVVAQHFGLTDAEVAAVIEQDDVARSKERRA